ncbi:MAG: PIG-L family deacetylase [Phycisphaeraceae bacterium]|nr:PIG-L family deacetylase [Phycisphaeraceae bacterium]
MARILVVGPHPDDQELGMGGTIALLADQGHDLLLLDMTNGEPTPMGNPEVRAREAEAAVLALRGSGAEQGSITRVCLGLPNRFVEHSIAARHRVAAVIRAHRASIVFTPYFEDAHPDHVAATRIVEDARFDAKLSKIEMPAPPGVFDGGSAAGAGSHPDGHDGRALDGERFPPLYPKWLFYYYATHLRIVPSPSFVVDVSTTMARKVASILAYESQFVANQRNHGVVEWVRASATFLGSRIGVAAGEAFFTREPVGLTGFGCLA